MGIVNELIKSLRITIVLWFLVAVVYPGIIFAIGQVAFPFQANGSLIQNDQGQVIGSKLIGQPFRSDRYFHSRPSAVNYSTASPTSLAGASNFAPSNPALIDRVQLSLSENPGLAADLVYSSGSGLDPHISPRAALAQIDRVATTRQLPPERLVELVRQHTERRNLGLWGEPGVNVLQLNLALDRFPG